ncbi:50S ribosomal protein L10 [archaeon]|nr:50S ribosomal protein L10 [archaeon]
MGKKVVAEIPKKKIRAVKELVELINSKKTILVADISSIPGSQFQQIGKKLRGKAVVKVSKKNLLFRALDASDKKKAQELKAHVNGAVALLFSDLDSYELAGELIKSKSPAKAKPGQVAPSDLEVPAGPTDLIPGPAISELGALGIQIMIKGGKIEIKDPKVVTKEGETISQGAADILSKLDIKPFSIGFAPVSAYDAESDTIYLDIKIDKEGFMDALKEAYGKSLPFAMEIGYTTGETVKLMVQKAGSYEKKLVRVINGDPQGGASSSTSPEEVAPEEVKEEIAQDTPTEKKEEPKADAGAGLASLFG